MCRTRPTRGTITIFRRTKGAFLFYGQEILKRIISRLFNWFYVRLQRLKQSIEGRGISLRDCRWPAVQDLYLFFVDVLSVLGPKIGINVGDIS